MIVVDTSAIIAVVGAEPMGQACAPLLLENELLMSAATLTECLIVGARPEFAGQVGPFLNDLELRVIEVDEALARHAGQAYALWGKGFHPAKLNYGDCFSYALAKMYDCPLLYVGDDFFRTDVISALG